MNTNLAIFEGIVLGAVIGVGFAWMQLLALRRNEMLLTQQKLPASWRMLPGSGGRVALLLGALVGAQLLVPGANLWCLTASLLVTVAVPTLWRMFHNRTSVCA